MWHWLDAKGNLDATQFWSKLWGQSRCKRRSLGQLPSKVWSQCLASWASSSRFCHHRASFRILTFYQNRFFWVPSDHIVDKIASEMEVASLQKQLLLLTLLKRRGSVTRRFWYPGLASVFGLKNILIDFAATSENEIEIEISNIILKTFFLQKLQNCQNPIQERLKPVTMKLFMWRLTLASTFGGIVDFHGCRRYKVLILQQELTNGWCKTWQHIQGFGTQYQSG